ncbi:hypothetical protein PoMZ_05065 [Pyricularia oryzae]|uniref:Uncharacterized protein n=1 Tax=Pyricularia oryzae TaxID=318829 RepID=A0A4P7NMG1_PYROR|nr:hypothetical protein PoMZ_05065 [Pyricularia oryzae]
MSCVLTAVVVPAAVEPNKLPDRFSWHSSGNTVLIRGAKPPNFDTATHFFMPNRNLPKKGDSALVLLA